MRYSKFAVNETPMCVWDPDLDARNQEFLSSLSPDYFVLAGTALAEKLDGDNPQGAAIGLRMLYGHAMESVAALLCAALQAPDCVVGWLLRYNTRDLCSLLQKIENGKPILTKLNLQAISWDTISAHVHAALSLPDKEKERLVKKGFADFWHLAAQQQLSILNRGEYNSIKHGLRVTPGGHTLSIGEEHEYGVSPPPEEMHVVASSEFGSSMFSLEPIEGTSRHFQLHRHSTNWHPKALMAGIAISAWSIMNLVSFIEIVTGADPSTRKFHWPNELSAFRAIFDGSPGSSTWSMNHTIQAGEIKDFSNKEIMEVYSRSESLGST